MKHISRVLARIYVLRPEEGGRKTGLFSGYRPMVFFTNAPEEAHDGILTVEGRDVCPPGEEATVEIEFLEPKRFQHLLTSGASFDLAEGRRIVAKGTVIDMRY